MARVTIYLPDEVDRMVRREAHRSGKSLSAYLTELVASRVGDESRRQTLERLAGSLEGRFPEIERLPAPEEPEMSSHECLD